MNLQEFRLSDEDFNRIFKLSRDDPRVPDFARSAYEVVQPSEREAALRDIGDRMGFDYRTVAVPMDNDADPNVIYAVPKKPKKEPLTERKMQELCSNARTLGYAPWAVVLYDTGRLGELVSHPYFSGEIMTIQMRQVIGDPTSMVAVRTQDVHTAHTLALALAGGTISPKTVADFLIKVKDYLKTRGQ